MPLNNIQHQKSLSKLAVTTYGQNTGILMLMNDDKYNIYQKKEKKKDDRTAAMSAQPHHGTRLVAKPICPLKAATGTTENQESNDSCVRLKSTLCVH